MDDIDQKWDRIEKEVSDITLRALMSRKPLTDNIEIYKVTNWGMGIAREQVEMISTRKAAAKVNKRMNSKNPKDSFLAFVGIGTYPEPPSKKQIREARREVIEVYEQGLALVEAAEEDIKKQIAEENAALAARLEGEEDRKKELLVFSKGLPYAIPATKPFVPK